MVWRIPKLGLGDVSVSISMQEIQETWVQRATHSRILHLKNPMDGGGWGATIQRVAKSQTRLSDFHFILPLLSWCGSQFIIVMGLGFSPRDVFLSP